ncbi:MAG: hypothetical protein IJ613_11125 [Muribaculaceae bacterium]|nr:hypothetical protein [Muribaculaceae bacterium]
MQKSDSARAMRAGLLMAEREHFIQTQVFAGGPKKDIFILHCAHLIVPLAPPKVLALGNENKKDYFYFALRSLNCTVGSAEGTDARQ